MGAVRQKIESLFDYRGDNARNAEGSAPRAYSSDYSPNNIKRVVISPNGVLVMYHKSCPGTKNRIYGFVEFSELALYKEEEDPKYKPILRILAHPLVCASVEEIIVLSKSLSGQVHPNYLSEIRLESMVASFKGEGTDLKTRINGRFKRLRYYTVMNFHFKEFLNFFGAAIRNGQIKDSPFISEIQAIKPYVQMTELAGTDYWKYNGCLTATYQFDISLKAYFDSLAQKREQEAKTKAVDAMREKRVGGKIEAINELIDDYLVYSKIWTSFYEIVKKEGTNGVLTDIGFVAPPEIEQVLPFKGMRSVPDKLVSKQPCSEAEALEKDEAMLKNYKAKCCMALAVAFMTALRSIKEMTLLQTIVNGCETTICVPKTLDPVVEDIQRATGVVFSGRQIEVSVVNSCYQFMKYFVDCEHTAPFNKSYWESKLRKGVAK